MNINFLSSDASLFHKSIFKDKRSRIILRYFYKEDFVLPFAVVYEIEIAASERPPRYHEQ